MRFSLIAVVALTASTIAQPARNPSHDDAPLERIVGEQPNGGPYVLSPPIVTWSDNAPFNIGRAASIPTGFEAAPEVRNVGVIPHEIAEDLKKRRRVSVAGMTVREALDTFVAIDPRYRWMEIDGVPVVRPWKAWADPEHPLNRVVTPVSWPEIDLATAHMNMATLIAGTIGRWPQIEPVIGPVPGAGRGPSFAVQTGPIAILELLNTIAEAHGSAGWWLRHNCTDLDPRAVEVWLSAYDGYGGGGCRTTKRQW
jgi:hypothetical protein